MTFPAISYKPYPFAANQPTGVVANKDVPSSSTVAAGLKKFGPRSYPKQEVHP